ncbi:hypothetical protein PHYPSEUDO_002560 [Phytophthora pseudosyringae]|uniref:Uncharacterized protein n=1 Tax=Phytophthora pseudosyringae TaxID=221518 RepID=A0A8T1V4I4_9STRA|nr:hypothetical protein PHYPSEUDO_002560 [Phytophthora pseudosyringae]
MLGASQVALGTLRSTQDGPSRMETKQDAADARQAQQDESLRRVFQAIQTLATKAASQEERVIRSLNTRGWDPDGSQSCEFVPRRNRVETPTLASPVDSVPEITEFLADDLDPEATLRFDSSDPPAVVPNGLELCRDDTLRARDVLLLGMDVSWLARVDDRYDRSTRRNSTACTRGSPGRVRAALAATPSRRRSGQAYVVYGPPTEPECATGILPTEDSVARNL